MHFHLLENPSAGRGRTRSFLDGLTRALEASGQRVTTHLGEQPGDLACHVSSLPDDHCDVLLVAGGDGTLNAVVNARPAPWPWPVGVLPVGTANLVAREAGTFPLRTPEETARALLAARRWDIDLIEIRRHRAHGEDPPARSALTNVSVGVDGAVVHAVAEARAAAGGRGGYARWIKPILRVRPDVEITVTVDDRAEIRGTSIVVQNAHCYGGLFRLAPGARLDSRHLDVVVFAADTVRDLVRVGVRAALRSAHRDAQIRIQQGSRVVIRAHAPVAAQADGDPAGHTDVDLRLRPAALTLLKARRPVART